MRHFLFVSFVALTLSCSGAEKSKATPPTDEVAETTVAEQPVEPDPQQVEEPPPDQGEGIPWSDKTHEQQEAYMKLTVKPRMEKLFQQFDPERFAKFKCSTCHGSDAVARSFEMPSPELPKLENFEKLEAEHPEMMEFMKKTVVPEMAAMLGQKPFDPETRTGFGCGACHTR